MLTEYIRCIDDNPFSLKNFYHHAGNVNLIEQIYHLTKSDPAASSKKVPNLTFDRVIFDATQKQFTPRRVYEQESTSF